MSRIKTGPFGENEWELKNLREEFIKSGISFKDVTPDKSYHIIDNTDIQFLENTYRIIFDDKIISIKNFIDLINIDTNYQKESYQRLYDFIWIMADKNK